MQLNFKKLLLTGTALVAVSAFGNAAHAQVTLSAGATWGVTGGGVTNGAGAGQAVTMGANSLLVTNDGAASDGSANTNTFSLGAISSTTGALSITQGSANSLGVTITSFNGTGAANFTVTGAEDAGSTNVSVTGGLSTLGALSVTNAAETSANDTVTLTIGGNVAVTNASTVTGGGFAGALTKLVLNGTDNTFTGGLTLTPGVGGANLTLSKATAQTFTGAIAGTGTVTVDNAAGATFNGTVAASGITIDSAAAANSTATFKAAVTAPITLGGVGTGTNTVNFDTTTAGFTVTGAIAGQAGETDNINVLGGKTLVQGATAWNGNLDSVNVTGTGTKLQTGAAITATNISVGSGAIVDLGAHTVTGTVANAGTINFTADNAQITGNLSGAGTLNAANSGKIIGNVAQGAVTVATTEVLTVEATATTDGTYNVATTTLTNAAGMLFDADANKTQTVTGNIKGTVASNGTVTVGVDNEVEAYTFEGDIGEANTKINTFTITNLATAQTVNFKGNVYTNGAVTLNAADIVNFIGTTQTASGNVLAGVDANGTVNVGNGTAASNVTFGGNLGDTGGNQLAAVNVKTNSTANVSGNISTQAANDATNGIDVDGTLKVVTNDAQGAVIIETATAGDIDFDGTLDVSGTQNVTIRTPGTNNDIMIDGVLRSALNNGKVLNLTGTAGQDDILIGANSNTTVRLSNEVVTTGNTVFGAGFGTAGNKTVTLDISRTTEYNAKNDLTFGNNLVAVNAAGDVVKNLGTLVVTTSGQGTYGFDNNDVITVISSDQNAQIAGAVAKTWQEQLTAGNLVLQDTALTNLTLITNGAVFTTSAAGFDVAQDLVVRVTHNSVQSVITSEHGANTAQALLNINDTNYGNNWGTPGATGTQGSIAGNDASLANGNVLRAARNNLLAAQTAEQATNIAESMSAIVDGGAVGAAANVSNTTFGLANDRLAALRSGGETGMAAGNGMVGSRLWAQAFGSTADQGRRDGVDGYDADTWGMTVGLDTETILSNGILGVAFSYGDTEVDGDAGFGSNTNVDSYQVTLYGDYDIDSRTFINGFVAYAWNDVDTVRYNVGNTGLHSRGDYDADQFTAEAVVGRDYQYESMTVTPNLLAHWMHYDGDDYTETGAGNASLHVDQDTVNIFELGVGATAAWQYETASGMDVEPSLHVGYRYDLIGDEVQSTNRFIGGGQAFNTQGADPARSTFNVGAGMKLYTTDNWEFSAKYDFEYKADYDAHSGYLRAGVKF